MGTWDDYSWTNHDPPSHEPGQQSSTFRFQPDNPNADHLLRLGNRDEMNAEPHSPQFGTIEEERDHWKDKYDEVRDLLEDAKMEVGE